MLQGKRVTAVAAAKRHSLARTAEGDVWTWGHRGVSPRRVQLVGVRDVQRLSGKEVLYFSAITVCCFSSASFGSLPSLMELAEVATHAKHGTGSVSMAFCTAGGVPQGTDSSGEAHCCAHRCWSCPLQLPHPGWHCQSEH